MNQLIFIRLKFSDYNGNKIPFFNVEIDPDTLIELLMIISRKVTSFNDRSVQLRTKSPDNNILTKVRLIS